MSIRRLRLKSLAKKVFFLLNLSAGIYWIGSCLVAIVGPSSLEQYTRKTQRFESAYESLYTDWKFEQRSDASRKNLIIVSHGRSGSTLMGGIFNHHPSVFYMYEPLQTVARVLKKLNTTFTYEDLAKNFLTSVFRCKFDQPQILEDIEKFYRKPGHPRVSQAIASPPLCPYTTTDPRWDPLLCPLMTSESSGDACTNNYDLTTIKVLLPRVPENSLKTILTVCKPQDVDCKVIFLVRDPRAVIASSRSVGFFREGGDFARKSTRQYSYWQCKETEDNLEFIRKLPDPIRQRIKLQRYEDLAINPLGELSGLYKFAGLSLLESVRSWLNETTQQNRGACEGEQATCTKDDARVAANRWRWKVHPHEIDVIEHYCRGVMRTLGYRPVDGSYDLLADVKIPLFINDYEAKTWF